MIERVQTSLGGPGRGPEARVEQSSASTVRVVRGPALLSQLGEALDDLHRATNAPVTARRVWLDAWVRSYGDFEPWAVAVETDGRLEAAALLARRRRYGITEIVAMGHGPSDQVRLPARDARWAEMLAGAIVSELETFRQPWRLLLEQLPEGDPVARSLVAGLRCAAVVPGDGQPVLRFVKGRSLNAYLSRNSRGGAETKRNRVRRAGMTLTVESTRDPEAILPALPELERVQRARDQEQWGGSDLDDPRMAAFWRSVIADHARRGEVDLTLLRLSGHLAAFVVAFRDGDAYRFWAHRHDPAFGRFSPGALASQASVASALNDEAFVLFDWMRGEEAYKLRWCSEIVPAQHLVAWSSPGMRLVTESCHRLEARLRLAKQRHRWLEAGWIRLKPWIGKLRGRPPAGSRAGT
jgi:CelD/BcsL family acetyltransferase involved in cellulose biosynthesis